MPEEIKVTVYSPDEKLPSNTADKRDILIFIKEAGWHQAPCDIFQFAPQGIIFWCELPKL